MLLVQQKPKSLYGPQATASAPTAGQWRSLDEEVTLDTSKPHADTKASLLPEWALRHFDWAFDQIKQLKDIHFLSIQGMHAWGTLLQAAFGDNAGRNEERRLAALVDAERAQGFRLANGQALVVLWSYLEAMVRALLIDWLLNREGALQVSEISRLKIPYAEFGRLSEAERAESLFEHFEAAQGAGLRKGVQRFEVLLAPFGLSGPVSDDLGRTIFELAQVRNLLVHRGGVVDKRFSEACPWLDASVGQPLRVSAATTQQYYAAVLSYIGLLLVRVGTVFGVDLPAVAGQPELRDLFSMTPERSGGAV